RKARVFKRKEPADPAELGISAGPCRRTRNRTDRFHQRISGVDRDAGIGVGERLLAHRGSRTKDKPLGFPRRCRQKAPRMLRRRFLVPLLILLAVLGVSGALYAQLETADRGILPVKRH